MSDKPKMTYAQLVWQNRAIEHARMGCQECRAGGCISELRWDRTWGMTDG